MDYYNRMNCFKDQKFEDTMQWHILNSLPQHTTCHEYHSARLSTIHELFIYQCAYDQCVRLCQAELQPPKNESMDDMLGAAMRRLARGSTNTAPYQHQQPPFSPRKTPQYLVSRNLIAASVRDSPVPDYFKTWYMTYQAYSYAQLGLYELATSEAAHILMFLTNMVSRAKSDHDYIVDYTEEKKNSIVNRLEERLQDTSNFFKAALDALLDGSLPTIEPLTHVPTLDYLYDAAQAIYHFTTHARDSDLQAGNDERTRTYPFLLQDFTHAIFASSLAAAGVAKKDTRKFTCFQSSNRSVDADRSGFNVNVGSDDDSGDDDDAFIFPRSTMVTLFRTKNKPSIDDMLHFWRARLALLCASCFLKSSKFEDALNELGLAKRNMDALTDAMNISNHTNYIVTSSFRDLSDMHTHGVQFGKDFSTIRTTESFDEDNYMTHDLFDEIDIFIAQIDLNRNGLVKDIVHDGAVVKLSIIINTFFRKCQVLLRQRAEKTLSYK
ncbi:uncharacterized protein V1518DRAFT_409424 [Limtongia smithiae]|uniref:uncharacterized protein n=1 Tax=Limtongia smithiae TaxID=1125753 RepID=UPI0034CE2C93